MVNLKKININGDLMSVRLTIIASMMDITVLLKIQSSFHIVCPGITTLSLPLPYNKPMFLRKPIIPDPINHNCHVIHIFWSFRWCHICMLGGMMHTKVTIPFIHWFLGADIVGNSNSWNSSLKSLLINLCTKRQRERILLKF